MDGTRKIPKIFLEFGAINPNYLIWNRINGDLRSWLYGLIKLVMSVYIARYTNAYQQWHYLETVFVSTSESRKLEVCSQLQTKVSSSIKEYIEKIRNWSLKVSGW